MSASGKPTVEHDTLWEHAYAALRARLLAGQLAPGERLVLRQVADELGISLTPVRDAVNRLIAERVLERGGLGQAGGAVVPMLEAHQFRQIMLVRAQLEPVVAAAAASMATAQQLDQVEAHLIEMRRSVLESHPERYLEAHSRFHFGIYEICDMPIVLEIIDTAWLRCAPTLTLGLPQYIPGLKRYQWHVDALAALRRGDGETVARSIRADIENAIHDIGLLLEQAEAAA